MTTASSKSPTRSLCQGSNAKGGPCQNSIGASRIDPFCHRHRDQQGASPRTTRDRGTELVLLRTPEPVVEKRPTRPILPPSKFTAEELAQLHAQVNGTIDVQPKQERPMRAFPVTLRPAVQETPETAGHASFWTGCLRTLGCLPVTKLSDVEAKTEKAGASEPVAAPETVSPKQVQKIARKPVVYDVPDQPTSPIQAPSKPLPDQILQNHLDLQAHFERLTLSTGLVAHHVPLHTDPAMSQLSSTQYKKLVTYAKSLATQADAGTVAQPTLQYEYIYVFRLDGDHIWTPGISLKIGRTASVERRLRQWTQQCKQQVDFLDSFPTRHAGQLERLIHLELQADNVRKNCEGCGTVHREWFTLERDTARGRVRRCVERWQGFLTALHGDPLDGDNVNDLS